MKIRNKQILWDILVKYDNQIEMRYLCDSISNILQSKETEEDKINLIKFNNEVDELDLEKINKIINLTEILF